MLLIHVTTSILFYIALDIYIGTYIQGSIYIYMQNWNQYENCDWNPDHHVSAMHMRIQDRFKCLLLINFFEVIYEGNDFVCLRDQSYLFAPERLWNTTTTVRAVTNWWMLKELQQANIQRFSKGLACLSRLSKGQVLIFCWCVSKHCITEPYNFCLLPDCREMFSHWLHGGKKTAERSGT